MKLLLDTHAFLWAVMEPQMLSAKVRRLLDDPGTAVVVSAASTWEVAIKFKMGELPGAANLVADYDDAINGLQETSLPIRDRHALRAGAYPQKHADPIDRMLAAQAELEQLTLVSKNCALRQFEIKVLW